MADQINSSVKYKFFKQRSPNYRDSYWARCRAFYKGGECLLESDVMNVVFPKHQNEKDRIYELRKQMAHYTNYAGEIIDHLLAKLCADPLRVEGTPEPDEYYSRFLEDCTPPNGQVTDLNEFLKKVMLTAMQCKSGWVLVDMPDIDQDSIQNLAEQEAIGALDAWCVEVQPESVIDWEQDEAGELEWALLCFKSDKRKSITQGRDICREKYVLYTKSEWAVWEVEYKKGEEPDDDDALPLVNSGTHSFGHVPLIQMELDDGLWAMGKLESLAREHFNKRNALAWAEYKALLPVLYEFHNNDPVVQAYGGDGGDLDRAYIQPRAVNAVQVRNDKDRVEWVAPVTGPFEHSLKSIASLRDEMHRVVHQMAQAADNTGSMMQRSGESKKLDHNATNVILEALGSVARDFAVRLLKMVQYGRGDREIEWNVQGMTDFTTEDVGSLVDMEAILDTAVQIPSPTFKKIRKLQVVSRLLGDSLAEEDREKIEEELENYFSIEGELAEESLGQALVGVEAPSNDEGGAVEEIEPGLGRKPGYKSSGFEE